MTSEFEDNLLQSAKAFAWKARPSFRILRENILTQTATVRL